MLTPEIVVDHVMSHELTIVYFETVGAFQRVMMHYI